MLEVGHQLTILVVRYVIGLLCHVITVGTVVTLLRTYKSQRGVVLESDVLQHVSQLNASVERATVGILHGTLDILVVTAESPAELTATAFQTQVVVGSHTGMYRFVEPVGRSTREHPLEFCIVMLLEVVVVGGIFVRVHVQRVFQFQFLLGVQVVIARQVGSLDIDTHLSIDAQAPTLGLLGGDHDDTV